jgi:hypothetical protein
MLPKTSALDVNCRAYDADVAMLVKIYRRPIRRDDTAGQRQVRPLFAKPVLGDLRESNQFLKANFTKNPVTARTCQNRIPAWEATQCRQLTAFQELSGS